MDIEELKILINDISGKLNNIFDKNKSSTQLMDNDNQAKFKLMIDNMIEREKKYQIDSNEILKKHNLYIELLERMPRLKAYARMHLLKSDIELYKEPLVGNGCLTKDKCGSIIVGFIYTPSDLDSPSLSLKFQLSNAMAADCAYGHLMDHLYPENKLKVGDKVNLVPMSKCQVSSEDFVPFNIILEPYKFTLPLPNSIIPTISAGFTSIFCKSQNEEEVINDVHIIYADYNNESRYKKLVSTSWNLQLNDNTWLESYQYVMWMRTEKPFTNDLPFINLNDNVFEKRNDILDLF
jgi:hypothetical protein